jgi:hypothetical protein
VKIGYLPEGSTDGAVIAGLRDQLCPGAELIEGTFRGSTTRNRPRELRRACLELREKGADVIVDLNDANEMTWSARCQQERAWIPQEYHHRLITGAPKPNIEAWLIADAGYFQRQKNRGCRPKPDDPKALKALVEEAFGVTGIEKKEDEISGFVAGAPLTEWERDDNSFGGFLQECRNMAHQLNCDLST